MVAVETWVISGDRRSSRTDGKSEDAIRSNERRLKETFDSTVEFSYQKPSVVNSAAQKWNNSTGIGDSKLTSSDKGVCSETEGKPLGQVKLSAQSKVDESYKHRSSVLTARDYFDNRQGHFFDSSASLVLKNTVESSVSPTRCLIERLCQETIFIIMA
ncbi:unnamed protein product [Oikopleura dioica]|uniref:Uncharacterized protein n=1 Tax=Oikopleura dioica TaxID=34765 RepID=E4WQV3_OIKDI|nr:unnamed protein product [Oikopleura dioica]CBY42101.1 unnamed protein product [Oikopleura dioica]